MVNPDLDLLLAKISAVITWTIVIPYIMIGQVYRAWVGYKKRKNGQDSMWIKDESGALIRRDS